MTTPTLHGPPLIRRAMDAARTAGATPVGCQVTGKRIAVELSGADDVEAVAFAHDGSLVEGDRIRRVEVVVDGRRVSFWAVAA